jgi:hypothetical protein
MISILIFGSIVIIFQFRAQILYIPFIFRIITCEIVTPFTSILLKNFLYLQVFLREQYSFNFYHEISPFIFICFIIYPYIKNKKQIEKPEEEKEFLLIQPPGGGVITDTHLHRILTYLEACVSYLP